MLPTFTTLLLVSRVVSGLEILHVLLPEPQEVISLDMSIFEITPLGFDSDMEATPVEFDADIIHTLPREDIRWQMKKFFPVGVASSNSMEGLIRIKENVESKYDGYYTFFDQDANL